MPWPRGAIKIVSPWDTVVFEGTLVLCHWGFEKAMLKDNFMRLTRLLLVACQVAHSFV